MDLATLESLGITREEVLEKVTAKIAASCRSDRSFEERVSEEVYSRIEKLVTGSIRKTIDKHVTTDLLAGVEGLVLRKTNTYGEPTGETLTFREYISQQAENYLLEKVDRDGKISSYGDRSQTRGAYIISEAIADNLRKILSEAMMNAQTVLAKSVTETVKLQMEEIVKKFNLNIALR
jgi:hypothetical protein